MNNKIKKILEELERINERFFYDKDDNTLSLWNYYQIYDFSNKEILNKFYNALFREE